MSVQLAMVIDSSRCIDCKACVAACKVANRVPDGFSRNWIKDALPAAPLPGPSSRGHFQPGACMHCEKPLCVDACPSGATFKDPADGAVKIDNALCIGCGACIPACPYGARFKNPVRHTADKCDYCPERRARGLAPACVDTCPTKARVFGDVNDPDSEAARLLARFKGQVVRLVNAATDTRPNMFYLGATAPADWPHKAEIPAPVRAMAGPVTSSLTALVGMAAFGVGVMAVRQLLAGRGAPDKDKE